MKKNVEINDKLNIWKYKEYYPWYRPDKKIIGFFRKFKWTWQRAKYGFCDKDLWSLDYTLGNYIAATLNKLADTAHSHPYTIGEKEWEEILRNIANDFYYGSNEDCYTNIYEDKVLTVPPYYKQTEEQKELWRKYSEDEIRIGAEMERRRHLGFVDLEKWFPHLWD